MAQPVVGPLTAKAIALVLVISGLIILGFLNMWWPYVLLVAGLPLALKNYLVGRYLDFAIWFVVYVGAFIIAEFHLRDQILLPVFLGIGAVYAFVKGFFRPKTMDQR